MEELDNILKDLADEKDNKLLVIKLLTSYSLESLDCAENIIKYDFPYLVFPLFRKVYESCIYIIGLKENIISLNEFINATLLPIDEKRNSFLSKTSKKIHTKLDKDIGRIKADVFKAFLMEIYSYLSKHTHVNMDSLHFFIIHKYTNKDMLFLNYEIDILKAMLLTIFFELCNDLYSLNLEIPNSFKESFEKEIAELKNTRIESNRVLWRFNQIKEYQTILMSRKSDFEQKIRNLVSEEGKKSLEEFFDKLKE